MEFTFIPRGVCSTAIRIRLENDVIEEVKFEGGCNGNAQGISKLVVGMNAQEVADRLKNIRCGFKESSCPDQLARALEEALGRSHDEQEGEG